MTRPANLGPVMATDANALIEYAVEGHREIAPIIITEANGPVAIRGAQGIYRVGRHRGHGGLVLLFCPNPAFLQGYRVTDPETREHHMPGYCLGLEEERLRHIQVVEGRPRWTNAPWIHQAVHRHAQQLFRDTTEYAYLLRVNERMWVSGAISYRLETLHEQVTAENKAKLERKLRHELPHREPGEELYRLRCYTTRGKNHDFADMDGDFLDKPWGKALSATARWTVVTMREAEEIIADDFVKRNELVVRGLDPDKLGRPLRKTEPHMKSRLSPHELPLPAMLGKRYAARGIQECYNQFRSIEGKNVFLSTGKAIALAGSKLVLRGPVPALARLGLEIARPVVQPFISAFSNSGHIDFRRNNTARDYWRPNFTVPCGPDHYAPLDPAQAPYIRLLDDHEARVAPEAGVEIREELSDTWAENKLLDSLGGPPGSILSRHRPAGAAMDILHVRQPDGLHLDYLIGKEIAYARYVPESDLEASLPLPERLRRLLDEDGVIEQGHILRIHENAAGEPAVTVFTDEQASRDAFRADTRDSAEGHAFPQPDYEISPELQSAWEKADRRPPAVSIYQKAWSRTRRSARRLARKFGRDIPEPDPAPKLSQRERDILRKLREREPADDRPAE